MALCPETRGVTTYPAPEHGWTCFHCGETFTTYHRARDHFGRTPECEPGCVLARVAVGEERGMLMRLRRVELERDLLEVRLNAVRFGVNEDEAVARFMATSK